MKPKSGSMTFLQADRGDMRCQYAAMFSMPSMESTTSSCTYAVLIEILAMNL